MNSLRHFAHIPSDIAMIEQRLVSHVTSNNTDMLDTNDAGVSAVVIQGVGLPADESEAIEDDGNGHETHGSATDINIHAASANYNLRHLREGLRNTNK